VWARGRSRAAGCSAAGLLPHRLPQSLRPSLGCRSRPRPTRCRRTRTHPHRLRRSPKIRRPPGPRRQRPTPPRTQFPRPSRQRVVPYPTGPGRRRPRPAPRWRPVPGCRSQWWRGSSAACRDRGPGRPVRSWRGRRRRPARRRCRSRRRARQRPPRLRRRAARRLRRYGKRGLDGGDVHGRGSRATPSDASPTTTGRREPGKGRTQQGSDMPRSAGMSTPEESRRSRPPGGKLLVAGR
jgi:hypothetical protein